MIDKRFKISDKSEDQADLISQIKSKCERNEYGVETYVLSTLNWGVIAPIPASAALAWIQESMLYQLGLTKGACFFDRGEDGDKIRELGNKFAVRVDSFVLDKYATYQEEKGVWIYNADDSYVLVRRLFKDCTPCHGNGSIKQVISRTTCEPCKGRGKIPKHTRR
jgi:hypothetical protein